jgi:hypothetical protein
MTQPSGVIAGAGMRTGKLYYAFSLVLLLVICGCSAPNYYVRPKAGITSIKKIAVLPMESLTSDVYAGENVRRAIITELMSRGIDVVEPGEITKVLNEMKIRSVSALSVADMQKMSQTLSVDAMLLGSVGAYGISKGISVSYPEVAINLKMYSVAANGIIWSAWHTGGGPGFWTRHFGAEGSTLSEVTRKVVRKSINTMFAPETPVRAARESSAAPAVKGKE